MLDIISDQTKSDDTILTQPDLLRELCVTRQTLAKRVRSGDFPQPFRDGCRQCWMLGTLRRFYRTKARAANRQSPAEGHSDAHSAEPHHFTQTNHQKENK